MGLAAVLRILHEQEGSWWKIVLDYLAFQPRFYFTLSSLIGFLVVFRTSISYSRFSEGARLSREMMSEWFNCCSTLVAFCTNATATHQEIEEFKNVQIRLFCLLHACAVVQLANGGSKKVFDNVNAAICELQIFDLELDDKSWDVFKQLTCKVELVHWWIQSSIVENMTT